MENGHFSGQLWPDWGNTTWAAMAGLGSIGLTGLIWNIPTCSFNGVVNIIIVCKN